MILALYIIMMGIDTNIGDIVLNTKSINALKIIYVLDMIIWFSLYKIIIGG